MASEDFLKREQAIKKTREELAALQKRILAQAPRKNPDAKPLAKPVKKTKE